eukprot:13522116-Alexandrium_andersonii.AAC.1
MEQLQAAEDERRAVQNTPEAERIDECGQKGDSRCYRAHPAHPSGWQAARLTRPESIMRVQEGPSLSRRRVGPSGTSRTLATPASLAAADTRWSHRGGCGAE